MSIHPRLLLKGAAALLALLLSALAAPRAVAGGIDAEADRGQPAITSPLCGWRQAPCAAADPAAPRRGFRQAAAPPTGRIVPAPCRRCGCAGGPRAP